MRERGNHLRRTALGLGATLAGALILVGALPGPAGAGEEPTDPPPTPEVVPGNPTCAELGEFDSEFKIDAAPEAGVTYEDPDSDFEVTITEVVAGNPVSFGFEANTAVSAVFVKAGPGGLLYTFEPPTTSASGLLSPRDSISHVSFCWNDEDGTTTTTGPDETTSTTAGETTTTTGPDETTSTTAGEGTTTTAGPGGTTTEPAGPTTTTPDEAGTSPTTQPVGDDELPRTGSSTAPLLAVGAGLLGCGAALVAATHRLRHR